MGSQVHALSHVMRFPPTDSSASLYCLKQMRYGRLKARNAALVPLPSHQSQHFVASASMQRPVTDQESTSAQLGLIGTFRARDVRLPVCVSMTRHPEGFGIESLSLLAIAVPYRV